MFSEHVTLCSNTKISQNVLPFISCLGMLAQWHAILMKVILKAKTSKEQTVTVSLFTGGLIEAIDG